MLARCGGPPSTLGVPLYREDCPDQRLRLGGCVRTKNACLDVVRSSHRLGSSIGEVAVCTRLLEELFTRCYLRETMTRCRCMAHMAQAAVITHGHVALGRTDGHIRARGAGLELIINNRPLSLIDVIPTEVILSLQCLRSVSLSVTEQARMRCTSDTRRNFCLNTPSS